MNDILNFYKKNGGGENVKLAEEYLMKDTISSPLMGNKKIKELDGMDMESKASGKIIPSMIYTFTYDTNKDMSSESDFVFGDKYPMVLCCEIKQFQKEIKGKIVKGLYLIGVNLNFLTNDERAIVLNSIQNAFSNFYDNLYKDVYANKLSTNKGLQAVLMGADFPKKIQGITGIDVSKCIRSYNVSFCKNIRLIEYNLWKYIPLYNAKRTVTNLSLDKIQKIMKKK